MKLETCPSKKDGISMADQEDVHQYAQMRSSDPALAMFMSI